MNKAFFSLLVIAAAVPAYACDSAFAGNIALARLAGGDQCGMQENMTLTVNFNFKAKNFTDAKQKFDQQLATVTEYAKQQKIKKFDLQNQNYNIYAQPSSYNPDGSPTDYTYQVTGSSNYMMDNADAAFKFAEFLTQLKMQVSLNSNSYRTGNNCPPAGAAIEKAE
jgi:uncharacterized protein YggE